MSPEEPRDLSFPDEWKTPPIRLADDAEQDSEPGPFVGTDEIVEYAREHGVKWWEACQHFTDEGRDIGTFHTSLAPPAYWRMREAQGKPDVTAAHLAEQAEIQRLSEVAEKIPPRRSS